MPLIRRVDVAFVPWYAANACPMEAAGFLGTAMFSLSACDGDPPSLIAKKAGGLIHFHIALWTSEVEPSFGPRCFGSGCIGAVSGALQAATSVLWVCAVVWCMHLRYIRFGRLDFVVVV